jgi:hypothetical protein
LINSKQLVSLYCLICILMMPFYGEHPWQIGYCTLWEVSNEGNAIDNLSKGLPTKTYMFCTLGLTQEKLQYMLSIEVFLKTTWNGIEIRKRQKCYINFLNLYEFWQKWISILIYIVNFRENSLNVKKCIFSIVKSIVRLSEIIAYYRVLSTGIFRCLLLIFKFHVIIA